MQGPSYPLICDNILLYILPHISQQDTTPAQFAYVIEEVLRIGARIMSQKRNGQEYFEKACAYDMMANYYKYLDPNMHMYYYKKHLQALTKAFQQAKSEYRPAQPGDQPKAIIRFLNATTDAPNLDVNINSFRIFRNLPYKQVSNYLSLPAGKHHIDIYPADNQVSSILNKRIELEPGKIYTMPIIGAEDKYRLISFEDQLNVPKGETKFRFIHLAQDSPQMDLAVVKGDVVFPKISFKAATRYLGLTPMSVDLELRKTGTKEVLMPLHNLQFKENEVYSIIAAGLQQGEPPFETFMIRG